MSPTERTLKWLRTQGYTCAVVERRIPHTFTTRDLFGCIDIVAIKPGQLGVLGVQVTSAAHLADRTRKVLAEPRSAMWRACGNWLWVVGWSKKGAQGTRKLWVPTVVTLGEDAAHFGPGHVTGSATIPA